LRDRNDRSSNCHASYNAPGDLLEEYATMTERHFSLPEPSAAKFWVGDVFFGIVRVWNFDEDRRALSPSSMTDNTCYVNGNVGDLRDLHTTG
jgi:hypothetical protein